MKIKDTRNNNNMPSVGDLIITSESSYLVIGDTAFTESQCYCLLEVGTNQIIALGTDVFELYDRLNYREEIILETVPGDRISLNIE